MKRVVMLSFVFVLVLVSSVAFAADFPALHISIQEPQNWQAEQDTYPTFARNVPCIELTDMVNSNRWLWIFLDDKMDAGGIPLSLNEVGKRYVQWHTENDRRADRIDDRKNNGYFELEYYLTPLNTIRQVFIDRDRDSRITAGQYLCYLYPDTVTEEVALNILGTMIINDLPVTPAPTPTPTSQDPTPAPVNSPDVSGTVGSSSGGGGGCSAGLGSLALLALCSAFIVRKSR